MAKLSTGVEYWELNTIIGGISTTLHVVRANTAATPCIIGSLLNERDQKDKQKQDIYKKRVMRNLVDTDKSHHTVAYELSKNDYPLIINNKLRFLKPMWISNGVFFNDGLSNSTNVYGPIVHRGSAEVDVNAALVGGKNPDAGIRRNAQKKIRRWYTDHHAAAPFAPLGFFHNDPVKSAELLAQSEFEVIGGGGILIENGVVHTGAGNFWPSTAGGGFDGRVTYSCGPIIAQSSDTYPIYYMILSEEGNPKQFVNWDKMASYLKNSFTSEINFLRNPLLRTSSTIYNAMVYDGGKSRQVWVRNQGLKYVEPSKSPVPHYICLWA